MHKVKTDVQKHVILCVNIHARMAKIAPFPAMKEQPSTFVFAVYLNCRWSSYLAITVKAGSQIDASTRDVTHRFLSRFLSRRFVHLFMQSWVVESSPIYAKKTKH